MRRILALIMALVLFAAAPPSRAGDGAPDAAAAKDEHEAGSDGPSARAARSETPPDAEANGAPAEEGGVDFAARVRPILEEHCYQCHGIDKQKGDLRLDTKERITRGEFTVIPGDAIGSDLYFRVSLPPDDADVMPPEDADAEHLSEKQRKLIERWIKEGADFGGWEKARSTMLTQKRRGSALPRVPPADESTLDRLRERGAAVASLTRDTNLITVDFRGNAGNIGGSHLDALRGVAQQVAWLNLANTKISDDDLAKLAALTHLRRLHLENTAVGDAGMIHLRGLKELRYLNLYATRVTDAGLIPLSKLSNLEEVFVWRTRVSEAGARALKQVLGKTRVNYDEDLERRDDRDLPAEKIAEQEKKREPKAAANGGEEQEEGDPEPVVKLAGPEGEIPGGLDPAGKPLTLGARVVRRADNCVLLAQGGAAQGFSLYLKEGRPHFAVRSAGGVKQAAGEKKLPEGQAVVVVGVLRNNGKLGLYVDGERVAAAEGHKIAARPGDPFEIGDDGGSHVASYGDDSTRFQGDMTHIRLYFQALDQPAIRQWIQNQ